jgi:hypothetical protein
MNSNNSSYPDPNISTGSSNGQSDHIGNSAEFTSQATQNYKKFAWFFRTTLGMSTLLALLLALLLFLLLFFGRLDIWNTFTQSGNVEAQLAGVATALDDTAPTESIEPLEVLVAEDEPSDTVLRIANASPFIEPLLPLLTEYIDIPTRTVTFPSTQSNNPTNPGGVSNPLVVSGGGAGYGGGGGGSSQSTPTTPAPPADDTHENEKDTTAPTIDVTVVNRDTQCFSSGESCTGFPGQYTIEWEIGDDAVVKTKKVDDGTASIIENAGSESFIMADGDEKVITFSAIDIAGNERVYTLTLFASEAPIIISEIGWMGLPGNPAAVWLEIYNRSPATVDLNTLSISRLQSTETGAAVHPGYAPIELTGTIASHGYKIIAYKPNNVSTSTLISAGLPTTTQFITETGSPASPSNTDLADILGSNPTQLGVTLGTKVIDATPPEDACGMTGGVWCAGSQELMISMERFDYTKPGNSRISQTDFTISEPEGVYNWGSALDGQDPFAPRYTSGAQSGKVIMNATPGTRNSINHLLTLYDPEKVTISDSLTVTVTQSRSPYYIPDKHHNTIPNNMTLHVEPGVVIKMPKRTATSETEVGNFTVYGSLELAGSLENPIHITSFVDDRAGDTNNDEDDSIAGPGDWQSIVVADGGKFTLDYATIQYGGSTDESEQIDRAMIVVKNGETEGR